VHEGGRLWRHGDFLKLWAGQSVSQLGTQVTQLALPTAAIMLLHAGPVEVGLLGALQYLAFPTLGLVVGVWADRVRRRPLLIAADALRMLALGSVPAAALLGALSMWQLYAVAAISGAGTVLFDVTYQSYLPVLVDRRDLVEGNSKLETTRWLAIVVGSAVAGFLIQLFRAAAAILVDAASYVVSIATVWWIRRPEPPRRPATGERSGFLQELREGLQATFGSSLIRLIVACSATSNLGTNLATAVYLLFAYRQLHLSPGQVGLISAVGTSGALFGAVLAAPIARRLGIGPTLTAAAFAYGAGTLLLPLAAYGAPLAVLPAGFFIIYLCNPLYDVNQVSLRQAIVPVRLQGRLNASARTVIRSMWPVGAAAGGLLGARIGYVPTLYTAAAVTLLAGFWLLLGPVALKKIPLAAEDEVALA
jgi:MFS family permease